MYCYTQGMKEHRLRMRRFLKSIDEASLRKLCEIAMLTKMETEILVMSLSQRLDLNFVADTHNISLSTLGRKSSLAVRKVVYRLGISPESSDSDIHCKVGQMLREV